MSSLAQEESRSISENVTRGQRKRMADGKVSIPFMQTLGFKRGPKGEILVDEEQAKTVKIIYDWFLEGLTPHTIAERLTEKGIPTSCGKKVTRFVQKAADYFPLRMTRASYGCRIPF